MWRAGIEDMLRSITSTRLEAVEIDVTSMTAEEEALRKYRESLEMVDLLGRISQFPQLKKVDFVWILFQHQNPPDYTEVLPRWFPELHQRGILYIGGKPSRESR